MDLAWYIDNQGWKIDQDSETHFSTQKHRTQPQYKNNMALSKT